MDVVAEDREDVVDLVEHCAPKVHRGSRLLEKEVQATQRLRIVLQGHHASLDCLRNRLARTCLAHQGGHTDFLAKEAIQILGDAKVLDRAFDRVESRFGRCTA